MWASLLTLLDCAR